MGSSRIVGVPGSGAWAFLARSILGGRVEGVAAPKGPLVLVVESQSELEDIRDAFDALAALAPCDPCAVAAFGEDERARLAALEQLGSGARLVLALPEALAAPLPAPREFGARSFKFSVGSRTSREKALQLLEAAGYQRVDFVESPGEYAARGAVVDFFGLEPLKAIRLLFDEDNIASIRVFDPVSQSTLEMVSQAKAVPAAPPESGGGGRLSDWIGPDALWLKPESLEAGLPDGSPLISVGALGVEGELDFGAREHDAWPNGPASAWAEMKSRAEAGWKVALYSLNRGEDQRVQELLEEKLAEGQTQFLIGPLRRGFTHPARKLLVLATSEVFARQYRPLTRWKHFTAGGRPRLRFNELRQGDFVVHQDYGVSRYRGLRPIEAPGSGTVDCLLLEFRGSDRLYVPMNEFGRVQKFSGAEGKRPRLSSLDTRRWEEIKRQVKEGVRELAEQLLRTQAARAARPGHAFAPESLMEREFGEEFPYETTPDQEQAIRDVLADMEAPLPMDRVVVGDVGFGKTEVAMRAVFKCVTNYKQAAVLVPTTILADQHYRTFSARMADYPVKLGLLTRFQTKAEQARVVAALKKGELDAVIGTSRLLQKDIGFKDLGLVVVDEEHRFGVKDKERFKSMRASVDFLSLSATPIPRTLNQAMSGLRGISLIQSAPSGRQPIVTKVGAWDEGVIAHAIGEEIGRGGQAYYVHNRVRTLRECAEKLKRLVPQARLGIVHGQMKALEIEEAMWGFFHGKFDCLVASTIIESGLDIPTVNTLLVDDAHEFGLAQLYQLRGRIGRERQRAYCYLFYPDSHSDLSSLSEDARKRLEALKEFGALGAGIKLAMRDLEIRGAGELLGARQHGYINAVGVDYYSQLLNEEIALRQGKPVPSREKEVQIDLQVPAFIPESYLPAELERLEYYKRILRAEPAQAGALLGELEDFCGPAPGPVRGLFSMLKVRALARKAGVRSIIEKRLRLQIHFRQSAEIPPAALRRWTEQYKGRLSFLRDEEGDGVEFDLRMDAPLPWLEAFLSLIVAGPEQGPAAKKMIP